MELEESQQELKHVCKFCSKSFACGRSLGGHMRSHMINDISSLADGTKLTKKKLPPLSTYLPSYPNHNLINNKKKKKKNKEDINNIGLGSGSGSGTPGYVLREKPKRAWKFSDQHSIDDNNINNSISLHHDKSCKDCGKVFQSWKALFGHMKSHSMDKESLEEEEEEEEEEEHDSSTIANNNNNSNHKLVMDSQSDNETAALRRRKRSKRRTRYMGTTANSSSLSIPNNASSSVSGIEQEQEEVALCLIMLSRDVGQWGGLNSLAETSDNNSTSLGTNLVSTKSAEGKNEAKLDDDVKFEDRKREFFVSGVELGKNLRKECGLDEDEAVAGKYKNLSKRKSLDSFDPEMKLDSSQKFKGMEAYASNKFECTTCNKVFCSYQALGGHSASHQKSRGCIGSKLDSGENSFEMEDSPDQILPDCNKLTSDKLISNEIPTKQLVINCENKAETSNGKNKSKAHECPICFKVFQSGQALGGHKRAHIVGVSEAKTKQAVDTQEPIPAIRDSLDLNHPAPVGEESNGIVGFKPMVDCKQPQPRATLWIDLQLSSLLL